MPDPTPDEPRRTPTREGIAFARGSIADARASIEDARRALAASRPAPEHVQAAARAADAAIAAAGGAPAVLAHVCPPGRHRPDDDPTPGDRCKDCGRELTWRGPGPRDWDVADPATGESVARDPAGTMRAAAQRLRDPYRCNSVRRADQALADWLDSAAYDAEEIGSDFRAERVAAAILDRPDPHPGVASPAQVREQLDPATAASLTRYADDDEGTDEHDARPGLREAADQADDRADAIEAGRLAP